MKWIYIDCRESVPKTLFECQAEDVLSADKLFEMSTGLIAAKQPYITVRSPDWYANDLPGLTQAGAS